MFGSLGKWNHRFGKCILLPELEKNQPKIDYEAEEDHEP
jgi:hypothetical protein